MFKKPLADAKTTGEHHYDHEVNFRTHPECQTAPIRGSDRRKLKQRVIAEFSLQPEEGDALVPEGLLSQKISTHLNEPGVRSCQFHRMNKRMTNTRIIVGLPLA